MKISAEMIAAGLAPDFDFTVHGKLSAKPTFSKILFAEAGESWREAQVYLVNQSDAPPLPNHIVPCEDSGDSMKHKIDALLLIIGQADESFLACFTAALVFPDGVSVFSVHNHVQGIFARYDLWDAEIHHILSSDSDVQLMIDASTELFGNPLFLHDSNFKAVAVSSAYAEHAMIRPLLDNMRLPYLLRSDTDAELPESVHVMPVLVNDIHAIYVNLSQQNSFKYRLILLDLNHCAASADSVLLEYLAAYIHLAIGFVPEYTPRESELPELMEHILTGRLTDHDRIVKKLGEHGWRDSHSYFCMKIFADIGDRQNRTLRFISGQLSKLIGEKCVFEYEGGIVCFLNLSRYKAKTAHAAFSGETRHNADDIRHADPAGDTRFSVTEAEQLLAGFLRDNFLKAGLSTVFTGFGELRAHYTQAELALQLGQRRKPYHDLFHFADFVQFLLLESCTEKLPAHLVCAPELLSLRAYDIEHGTELLHTLEVFLKNNLHAVRSAKELFVHRSTFLYRIERIRQITGIDPAAPTALWYLLLSFELLQNE